ncbi:uncharacterized protein LOC111987048 [Quercus suber]|uniref:uncharacterized protein LOC111987048 n=1 Tax=Quercus suber TaxID=58331 RepID=UPI000CE19AE4|nr:uncharacterized protein LOC111987048 [Quercus suber]POE83429.1 hypothetical protein CFP56_45007 [Quercus suber]
MVFKDYTFFSYVFLATTVILLTFHAHGAGLCDKSPNKQVCHSIVYTRTDPREAAVAACHKLVSETKVANVLAKQQPNSAEISKCITNFNGAIGYAKGALTALNANQPLSSNVYLTAAQNNYMSCDDGFKNSGKTNPIAKSTKLLQDMASVGAYLSTLVK